MNNLRELHLQLNSLTIFRNLLKSPVIIKFEKLLSVCGDLYDLNHRVSASCDSSDAAKLQTCAVKTYAEFVSELYHSGSNLSDYIYNFVIDDENFYIKAKAKGTAPNDVIEKTLEKELFILQGISLIKPSEIKSRINYDGFLPDWNTSEHDFLASYLKRIENISKYGFGIFSKHHVFTILNDKIIPVKYPDAQLLDSLARYEREREIVVKNTLALLSGNKASNVLLYGDAGTGKSSTVKAIANQYKDEGLRLIEVKKHQLYSLPEIMEQLSENPLKFIIFIDDLSFTENDDNFTALKAVLEGSVTAISKNIVIYATSNRRRLVKELFSSRAGEDEIHINDTLQETTSLAARFGLTIVFEKPDKDVYRAIVEQLATAYGIQINEQLFIKAEAFAIRSSGRSPRAAKQFIEQFYSHCSHPTIDV